MKANKAPEKIYRTTLYLDNDKGETKWKTQPVAGAENIEYVRTDAFIEKALKWYCLDCECNGNCKDSKCFFYDQYKRYLNGETNAIPPKFSDRIINENGSVSEKYRYRHFINRMQNAFIEKACEYFRTKKKCVFACIGEDVYRSILNEEEIEDFKNYIKGE